MNQKRKEYLLHLKDKLDNLNLNEHEKEIIQVLVDDLYQKIEKELNSEEIVENIIEELSQRLDGKIRELNRTEIQNYVEDNLDIMVDQLNNRFGKKDLQ